MTRQIQCLIVAVLMGAPALMAQDPIFSQFYSTPLVINPAFSGTNYAPRISATYRNEWPTFADEGSTVYSTYAASYEQFIPSFNSGIGLLVLADNAGGGLIKTTNFAASYAYRIAVNDDFFIKLGVQAGFKQSNVDWDRLVFLDQLDRVTGPVDPSGNPNPTNEVRPENLNKAIFDVGAGLLVYGGTFYGGLALHHLTTPDEGFVNSNASLADGLPLRLTLHGGAQFIVKEGNKRTPPSFISPNILLLKQGDMGQINLGAYYSLGLVFAGAWYRHSFGNPDAVIGMIGFQYDILKIGYSYDYTVSGLTSSTGGSHEISLVINLDNSENLRKKRFADRYNDCFKIFR
ncbi:MAG: type IX secretion system membrane protein PorP/SprF [Lewinellaceae bacterium]|nr:type IX secretion system membrane protein PorP/SprF [Saprospiraceae bacterium]MCB9338030.1 type IX secretion system membrane protein PorP/SprF [Lewinellaceae bacterium]